MAQNKNDLRICMACNHIGLPKKRGSGGIELILWLTYLIPGLLYHVWRKGGTSCTVCNATATIPVDSPKAQEIIKSDSNKSQALEIKLSEVTKAEKIRLKQEKRERYAIFVFGIVVMVILFWGLKM